MAQNEPKFGSRTYSWAVSKDLGRIRGLRKAISEILLGNRFLGIGRGKLLYVDPVLDHNVMGQLVRKTIVFCEQKRPEMAGIEAEQFQELPVHEFRRQCAKLPQKWPVYAMGSPGAAKNARIRRLSQYVINRELRFKADSEHT
jgi:hypothetical protein